MRDNKPLEEEAVKYVCTRLAKIDLKYAFPNFDENGGDLIVINEISHDTFKLLNIQVKGRDISTNNSNIKIHKSYVRENLVFFLYLRKNKDFNDYLYCFFDNEVSAWEDKGEFYYLNIPENSIKEDTFCNYKFNKDRADKIKSILDRQLEKHHADISEWDLTLIGDTLKLWGKTGFLPDEKLTGWFLENTDFQYSLIHHNIFLTCLTFIHSDKLQTKAGVDYIFQFLRSYNLKSEAHITDITTILSFNNQWLVNYSRSRVDLLKLKYNGTLHNGLKLIFGDSEERIEALLIDNGDLQLVYKE